MRSSFKEATNRPDMIFKNFFGCSWQPDSESIRAMDKMAELEKIELNPVTSRFSGAEKTHVALRNPLATHRGSPRMLGGGVAVPCRLRLGDFVIQKRAPLFDRKLFAKGQNVSLQL